MYRDLWTFLWSRKLATILLVFLILLAIVGATVPQESIYPIADFQQWQLDNPLLARLALQFKLTRLFESYLFIGCSLMLCLSLLFCSLRRLFLLFSGREERLVDEEFERNPQVQASFPSSLSDEQVLAISEALLKKKRFRCAFSDTHTLYAVRGRWGAFGSTIFHFSFLILLVGALLSTWARFEGGFTLVEGQSFRGLPGEYAYLKQTPLLSRETLPFQLNYESLVRVDEPRLHYRNQVSLQEESGESRVDWIRPFHALTYRGYTFYQKEHGFSPALRIRDKQGQVLFDAIVSLQTKRTESDVTYQDHFKVPGTWYTLKAKLYPDAEFVGSGLINRSEFPDNPVLSFSLMINDFASYTGSVKRGEIVETDDVSIEFIELRYWSSFRVVKDFGLPIIYASFFVGILGYFIRLFSVREVLRVNVCQDGGGRSIVVSGSTELNEALFAEKFEGLVSTLKQGVAEA